MSLLVFDLYCGLGGWSEAFIDEGYTAIGFDIEAHNYGNGGYPGTLVLRDVRTLNGEKLVKEFGVPTCIVSSSPCQEYSYMAMPWSKAKAKRQKMLNNPAERERGLMSFLIKAFAFKKKCVNMSDTMCRWLRKMCVALRNGLEGPNGTLDRIIYGEMYQR